jgi:hypothetical protein
VPRTQGLRPSQSGNTAAVRLGLGVPNWDREYLTRPPGLGLAFRLDREIAEDSAQIAEDPMAQTRSASGASLKARPGECRGPQARDRVGAGVTAPAPRCCPDAECLARLPELCRGTEAPAGFWGPEE